MLTKILTTLAFVTACQALVAPTGKAPASIPCPNYLCNGKYDGNYEYNYYGKINSHYFVQCSNGLAYCQACWPIHLVFKEECNQCLYSYKDECVSTKPWEPATTFECPDKCPHLGPYFSGNIEDPNNPHQYVACFHGATVGCIACPKGLTFNEEDNACLFEGVYFTETDSQKVITEEPHFETEKPHVETEKPHVETEKPHVETEKPHVETEKPHVETEKPHVETERPHVETEKPHVETEKPHFETENPHNNPYSPYYRDE